MSHTTPFPSTHHQVLFPYAKSHVGQHLLATFDTPETQADMLLLRAQIVEDIKSAVPGAEPMPPLEAGKEAVVLFPYAKSHVGQHLLATFDTPETQADMLLLRTQIDEDVKSSIPGAEPVPPSEAGKEAVVGAVERNVAAMIAADRKVTALKQLQGHIWRGGYEKGELKGEFFSDVLTALTQWHAAGCKIYIYSSGSREAQHLIFGYSNVGDLRRFISGFFDTTTGHKREARSYSEIALTLGADSPSHITFCTDILEEAQAAKQAGLQAVLLSRPGNGALPADPGFPVLTSLTDL
ncbi:unnamed protein product [Closterium sp. NIES-54]